MNDHDPDHNSLEAMSDLDNDSTSDSDEQMSDRASASDESMTDAKEPEGGLAGPAKVSRRRPRA